MLTMPTVNPPNCERNVVSHWLGANLESVLLWGNVDMTGIYARRVGIHRTVSADTYHSPHISNPESMVHEATIWPTWVLSAPDGPHVVLTNLAIRDHISGLYPVLSVKLTHVIPPR